MSMWERHFHHPDLTRFLESSDSGSRSPSAAHSDGHNALNSLKWNILLADHIAHPVLSSVCSPALTPHPHGTGTSPPQILPFLLSLGLVRSVPP